MVWSFLSDLLLSGSLFSFNEACISSRLCKSSFSWSISIFPPLICVRASSNFLDAQLIAETIPRIIFLLAVQSGGEEPGGPGPIESERCYRMKSLVNNRAIKCWWRDYTFATGVTFSSDLIASGEVLSSGSSI